MAEQNVTVQKCLRIMTVGTRYHIYGSIGLSTQQIGLWFNLHPFNSSGCKLVNYN